MRTFEIIPELVEPLTKIGYIYRGDGGDNGGHLFVKESAPDVRTVHLHVVVYGDWQWQNYLRFRDLLRWDGHLRREYAILKQELGVRYADDRKAYTAAKEDFIRRHLQIAQESNKALQDNLPRSRSVLGRPLTLGKIFEIEIGIAIEIERTWL